METTLGTHIRELRKRRGLTRMQLAVQVGVDPHSVGRWERDERNPHPHHLAAIAAALDVDPTSLGYEPPIPVGSEAPAWSLQQFEQLKTQLDEMQLVMQRIARKVGAS